MPTLPETNSSHLKMDIWNFDFLLVSAYFQGLLLLVLGRVIPLKTPTPRGLSDICHTSTSQGPWRCGFSGGQHRPANGKNSNEFPILDIGCAKTPQNKIQWKVYQLCSVFFCQPFWSGWIFFPCGWWHGWPNGPTTRLQPKNRLQHHNGNDGHMLNTEISYRTKNTQSPSKTKMPGPLLQATNQTYSKPCLVARD